MKLGIENRTAVVSAASRGIGLAIAEALASEGCSVAICARGDLESARKRLESYGNKFLAMNADITKPRDIDQFISSVENELGYPDILVTNAGGPKPGPFGSLTEDDWTNAVNLNLLSVARLCRRVLPGMVEKGWGRLVNMTSVSVKEPIDNLLLSNSIRPGVVGLSKTLSREYGRYGITVNCVAPGYTATERLHGLAKAMSEKSGKSKEDVIRGWTENTPLGRLGQPEEIANAVVFLCSEKAGFITGATISVDGGLVKSLL